MTEYIKSAPITSVVEGIEAINKKYDDEHLPDTTALNPNYLITKENDLEDTKPIVLDASGVDLEIIGTTGWANMDENNLMDMFGDLNAFREDTGKVQWDKLDYEIYGEDWYREKYPHFPDEWYELLVRASKEKYKDLQSGVDKGMKVERGNFVVNFD
tara:strand:- start:2308 stop:2778 length:471 start_codon:yes stop_codon:yes gene_type:complete